MVAFARRRRRRSAKFVLPSLCISISLSAAAAGGSIVLRDHQNYTSHSYNSYLSPWNKGALVEGVDYDESLQLNEAAYPNGQTIMWRWPKEPPARRGVYNFLHVAYGNYYDTRPKEPIPSVKVRDIAELTQSFNLSFGGDLDGFNVIDNLFLTEKPGNFEKILYEVEIFFHSPSNAVWYVNHSHPVGRFVASGIEWFVAVDRNGPHGQDVLIMPSSHQDAPVADKLNLKAMFDYLIASNVLSGDEYFNGLALGVEVHHGAGNLTINTISTRYH